MEKFCLHKALNSSCLGKHRPQHAVNKIIYCPPKRLKKCIGSKCIAYDARTARLQFSLEPKVTFLQSYYSFYLSITVNLMDRLNPISPMTNSSNQQIGLCRSRLALSLYSCSHLCLPTSISPHKNGIKTGQYIESKFRIGYVRLM